MHIVLEGEAEWILIYQCKKQVFLLLCSFREDVEVRLSIRLLCGLMGFNDEAIIIPKMCVIITKMAYLRRKSVEVYVVINFQTQLILRIFLTYSVTVLRLVGKPWNRILEVVIYSRTC